MGSVWLQPLPQTAWRKRRVLDEDGNLGPAEAITDIVYSTDPHATLERVLLGLESDWFVCDTA